MSESLWDTFVHDPRALPVEELRRLDAAEAIIDKQFGISPGYYLRAHEAPGRHAKLEHIVAALVLRRDEWEQPSELAPFDAMLKD